MNLKVTEINTVGFIRTFEQNRATTSCYYAKRLDILIEIN